MDATYASAFGRLLRRHRVAAGLTQEELAERAGLSVRAIGGFERSAGHAPRRATVELLMDALGLEGEDRERFESASRVQGPQPAQGRPGAAAVVTGGFLGAAPIVPVVGRHKELARLLSALDDVEAGNGRLLVLTGEPGVGKTRLAQEVAIEAERRSFVVAAGRCYEPDQSVPFYPFLDVLGAAYAAATPPLREAIPRRWPELARLLPEEDFSLPPPRAEGQEEQQRLFRAVSGFLQALAGEVPLAVLLDDLHWGDSASLNLLAHLTRRTHGNRVLLFGTYRDVGIARDHALERVLVDLNRERLVERLPIGQIGRADAGPLIAATLGAGSVPPRLASLIYRTTDGNPFFLQEMVLALVQRGDVYRQGDRWLYRDAGEVHVPETVRAAIAERLLRLRPAAQETLRAASVLGPTFSFDEVRMITDRNEDDLEEDLAEAAAAGLLREQGGDSYVFHHALTQQALYTDLRERRRRRLHLAAGEVLAILPGHERRATIIAHHLMTGGEPERAVPYAVMAGDQCAGVFAYEEAERQYRTVLELLDASPLDDNAPDAAGRRRLKAEVVAKLGRMLHVMERYDEALAAMEEAAALCRLDGDRDGEGLAEAEIGWLHFARRTAEQGIARLQPVIDAFEDECVSPSQCRTLAALYTALSRLSFGLGRYRDELAAANRAAQLARQVGDELITTVAEARRGTALRALGEWNEAQRVLEETVAHAEATGSLGLMSVTFETLSKIARDRGEFEESLRLSHRALEPAQQSRLPSRMVWCMTQTGRITFLMGDWRAAREHFELAAEIYRSVDLPWPRAYFSLEIGYLSLLEGNRAEAAGHLNAALQAAEARKDAWMIRRVQRLLAERDILEARPTAALARLQFLPTTNIPVSHLDLLLAARAEAHAEAGNLHEADRLLGPAMEGARTRRHLLALATMARVLGAVRSRQGHWDEARDAFAESVSLSRAMPYPLSTALALRAWSLAEHQRGSPAAARQMQAEAADIFERLGARPYLEPARRAMMEPA